MKKRITYKLLMLVMLLMGMGSSGHAEDVTLFEADFTTLGTYSTDSFSTTSTPKEIIIDGVAVKFMCNATNKGNYSINSTNGLTFPDNNMGNKYFIAIPLSGINGTITVTITHAYNSAKASFNALYIDGDYNSSPLSDRTATQVKDANSSDTSCSADFTATTNSGYLYIGRQSSNYTQLKSITITTQDASAVVVNAPVFDTQAGLIESGTTIKCSSSTDGAVVYYTTDGSEPTTDSNVFPVDGITLTQTTTFKAIAYKDGVSSGVSEATYIVRIPSSELTAVSEHFWKFSDTAWNPSGASGAISTYGNLYDSNTIELLATNALSNNTCNVTVDDIAFTRELKMGGKSSENNRVLHFKVTGPSVITVYGRASGTSDERKIVIATGSFNDENKYSFIATTAGSFGSTTTTNTGETDIYVYCEVNAVNFFGIKVEPANTKSDLTQFEFNLEDVYLSDGEGTGKFVNSSEIEYDETYTKLRLKLKIQPDLDELTDATFTVTSSEANVISAEGVGVWKAGDERLYVGQFTVNATGTTTISVTFNGNDDFNEKTITQEFTVVMPIQPTISYSGTTTATINEVEYPSITIVRGGATGKLDLAVDPENKTDEVLNDVVYSWEPLSKSETDTSLSDANLITISESGLIQTANKVGRALITATYGEQTAQYVVIVEREGTDNHFKFGNTVIFDFYENGVYKNPLVNANNVDISGDATWSVSDASIVSIDGKGNITMLQEGTVTVTAIPNSGENKQYTLTLIANPHKYIVKKGYVPQVGEQVTSVSGITMTYGGFTDNFGTGNNHGYTAPGASSSVTDKYNGAATDESGLDTYNYFFTGGTQDPRVEQLINGLSNANARGWDRMRDKSDYLKHNVVVYGTYFQFTPDVDGSLTVNVLQTGSIQDLSTGRPSNTTSSCKYNTSIYQKLNWELRDDTKPYSVLKNEENEVIQYNDGIIDRWNYKALYLTDERGHSVQATNKVSHSLYAHPWWYELPEGYRCPEGYTSDDYLTDADKEWLSLKTHIIGGLYSTVRPFNETTSRGCSYDFQYLETTDNDGNTIAAESVAGTKVKKEMAVAFGLSGDAPTEADYESLLTTDNVVHIMENENYGYWTLTQSNIDYTFPVKAGKTYFLFTDGSKLGLGGFTFVPDDDALTSTLEIDGSDTQTAATTLGEKNNCTVTLNRKLIQNQPNSLMLPFSVSAAKVREVFGENTQVLHVQSIDNCIHFVRHHHQMIVAGEPCIIYPSNATNTQWVFENVTVENPSLFDQYVPVSGGGYTFTGCFERTDMPAGSYYVSTKKGETQTPGGEDIYIYRVSKDDWMSNTRAFFLNGSGSSANQLGTALVYNAADEGTGSDIDGIRVIQAAEEAASSNVKGVYSISGQKMDGDNLQKGIYIINGRKVVIK